MSIHSAIRHNYPAISGRLVRTLLTNPCAKRGFHQENRAIRVENDKIQLSVVVTFAAVCNKLEIILMAHFDMQLRCSEATAIMARFSTNENVPNLLPRFFIQKHGQGSVTVVFQNPLLTDDSADRKGSYVLWHR